jgi:hypothetical protein
MIDIRYKPSWLPQMNAPLSYILGKLKDEGVSFKLIRISPKNLKPSQGIIFSDKVSDIDPNNIPPIWSSKDHYTLDGHHRHGSSLSNNAPFIKSIEIDQNRDDAARTLNKIMDIYEHEITLSLDNNVDEVVGQDIINDRNDPNRDTNSFLDQLEAEVKDGQQIIHDDKVVGGKKKTVKAYRKDPIKENSPVGNFFSLKPIDGYKKYEIEFNSLLNTNDMELIYRPDKNPIFILAKVWFPNVKFSNIAKKFEVDETILVNRVIVEKAKQMGYDGIKYGDIMIQGF